MVGPNAFQLLAAAVLGGILFPAPVQRFFPDDPLQSELPPVNTPSPGARSLHATIDYFAGTFADPGEGNTPGAGIPAQGINTMGEVMNGPWYVNRHARQTMSGDELRRGAGEDQPPGPSQPWRVLEVQPAGPRMGLLIEEATGRRYRLRFDPPDRLELSTAAGMISSRFLHALGYWTLEHYIVYFDRQQLVPDSEQSGSPRLFEADIDRFLASVPLDPERGFRALATRIPAGRPLGPFGFEGTRSDDPNDLFRHEHRRELRGLYVFSSWLNDTLPDAASTLDLLLEEEVDGQPIRFIRHYLVDLDRTLGSGAGREKEVQEGNEPGFSWRTAIPNFLSAGVAAPDWMRSPYPGLPSVGKFECQTFDPERWTPAYLPAPFANRLPDDDFWAAKTLMSLTDEDIRTVVATGEYSDAVAEDWIARCLIERRDRIGRAYFARVLPLDRFRVEENRLVFDDLSVVYGFAQAREYRVQWARFDNVREEALPPAGADGFRIPPALREVDDGEYLLARVSEEGDAAGAGETRRVDVYLRSEAGGFRVVAIDRVWPGQAP